MHAQSLKPAETTPNLNFQNGLPAVCVFNIKGSQVYSHNSVCNEKEAKFVAQLVSWLLVKGGVDPVQIGIVTLYKAQVQVIVSYLAQDPRSVWISACFICSSLFCCIISLTKNNFESLVYSQPLSLSCLRISKECNTYSVEVKEFQWPQLTLSRGESVTS